MGTFAYYTVLTLLVVVAVLLILLVLIQKGRGGGLSSAFGGGGGSSAFGAKTGDVLTWATSIIFGVFLLLAVSLDLIVDSQFKSSIPSTTGSLPAIPVPVSNTPDTTPPPTMPPATTSTAAAISDAVNKNVAPATQPAGANGMQILKNAATQATGAVKAATQPVGKMLNGMK